MMAIVLSWSQVNSKESNFVYYSHRLLVELAEGAMWIWKAMEDYHGTTVNSVALKNRKTQNWSNLARNNTNTAQWTMVSVLTTALMNAASKWEINAI